MIKFSTMLASVSLILDLCLWSSSSERSFSKLATERQVLCSKLKLKFIQNYLDTGNILFRYRDYFLIFSCTDWIPDCLKVSGEWLTLLRYGEYFFISFSAGFIMEEFWTLKREYFWFNYDGGSFFKSIQVQVYFRFSEGYGSNKSIFVWVTGLI